MPYKEQSARYYSAMMAAGATFADADSARRDAERIDTWNTLECGTGSESIQWGEDGMTDHRGRPLIPGKPYRVTGHDDPRAPGSGWWHPQRDTYTPAVARINTIAEKIGARAVHNSDPRGLPVQFVFPCGRTISPPIRPNKGF